FPDRRRLHVVWTGTILGAGCMVAVEMQRAGDRHFDGLWRLVERFCQAMVKKQADKLLPRPQEGGVVRTPGINRRSRIGVRCGFDTTQCGVVYGHELRDGPCGRIAREDDVRGVGAGLAALLLGRADPCRDRDVPQLPGLAILRSKISALLLLLRLGRPR